VRAVSLHLELGLSAQWQRKERAVAVLCGAVRCCAVLCCAVLRDGG
jgi:hypothetical protein